MLNLQELLDTFEYGHKFRIRIWCNNETAQILELDFPRRIHSSPLCDYIKSSSEGMKSCVRCKKCTEYLVHRSGTDGVCVHGLYEIVQPVISNGRHTATVYIGNMVDNQSESELKLRKSCEKYGLSFSKAKALLYKAECEFDPDIIKKTAEIIADTASEKLERHTLLHGNAMPEPISHLMDNLLYSNSPMTINSAAKELGYNVKYLGRLFKQHTGISFNEYHNRLKLQAAANLLCDGNIKIIDAALESGFNDVTYFNRIFHKEYGMTPSEYRKNYFKKNNAYKTKECQQ